MTSDPDNAGSDLAKAAFNDGAHAQLLAASSGFGLFVLLSRFTPAPSIGVDCTWN